MFTVLDEVVTTLFLRPDSLLDRKMKMFIAKYTTVDKKHTLKSPVQLYLPPERTDVLVL